MKAITEGFEILAELHPLTNSSSNQIAASASCDMTTMLAIGCIIAGVISIVTEDEEEDAGSGGLFPMPLNLASRAIITANATCGQHGGERYCKLVEHVKRPANNVSIQCGVCDARSDDENQRHPISNAIDGSQRWWQSPSIAEGPENQFVTIVLDLRQVSHCFTFQCQIHFSSQQY